MSKLHGLLMPAGEADMDDLVTAKVVTAPGPSSEERQLRENFQKAVEYLEKSYESASNSKDQAQVLDALSKFYTSIFQVTGGCKKRGHCCRNFTLYSGHFIRNQQDFEDAVKKKPQWSIFMFKESDEEKAFFTCSKLDNKTGLCTIYDDRPDICRDFPNGSLQRGLVPDDGCGYKYRFKYFLPILKNPELVHRIASFLLQLSMLEEAAQVLDTGGFPFKASFVRAQLAYRHGDIAKSMELLEHLLVEQPLNRELLDALAMCHLKSAERANGRRSENADSRM